jgi:hypothetical protein
MSVRADPWLGAMRTAPRASAVVTAMATNASSKLGTPMQRMQGARPRDSSSRTTITAATVPNPGKHRGNRR